MKTLIKNAHLLSALKTGEILHLANAPISSCSQQIPQNL